MKIVVLDGNSIANRAFYGTPPLTNRKGQQTGAILSFFKSIHKLKQEHQPDAFCITFDEKGPTFRHEIYADYKGTRKKMPDELSTQLKLIKEILSAMNIPYFSLPGWEADDLMGTISVLCQNTDYHCILVTGDKDALQLATDTTTIHMITTGKQGPVVTHYTPAVFHEEFGFPPPNLVDLKAMAGDYSDNIPGIAGIGPKTAIPLIQKYHSIDTMYKALENPDETLGLTPLNLEKMKNGREICHLSHDLAAIRCNAPLEFAPEDCVTESVQEETLLTLFRELELMKLLDLLGLSSALDVEIADNSIMEDCTIKEISDLAECTKILDTWGEEKVAVLTLPQLAGFCLHKTEGESATALIIMENNFDSYHEFMEYLFSSPLKLIVQNSKQLLLSLREESIEARNIFFDVEVAAYLLSPESKDYKLEYLASQYLHLTLESDEIFTSDESFSLLSNPQQAIASFARHCATLNCLEGIFTPELEQNQLTQLYYDIEFPLCAVLADIEHQGIAVDSKALSQYGDKVSQMLEETVEEIYDLADERFNINSPKQLGIILFEKLGLPPVKKTKTGYSTNVEVLEKLRDEHPDQKILALIMEQRHLSKLQSTYVKGLQKVITPLGKVHTSFQNTVTATGRLSSAEPNLQNIPIRTELGSELRKMFVAEPGNVLIDADYSQIELRLLAHIAQDEAMLSAFRQGEDIHSQTASQVFHVPQEEVTSAMRRSAKAVNFGIVYGMSAFALSQDIGVTVAEAKSYINRYFETYPNVKAYLDQVIVDGRCNGYVTTLLGRKRWLPNLNSSNFLRRSFAERMAQNTPIQGSAADIIKIAMISVAKRLKEEGLDGKVVLQVHDELLIQCPESQGEATATIIREAMEGVIPLSVPLLAETHIGKNWGEAH